MNAIRKSKTETTHSASQGTATSHPETASTVTIPSMLFLGATDELRRAYSAIDIASGMIRALVPAQDEDGDIDSVGRQVEFLTAKIAEEAEVLYRTYAELMRAAGYKADHSGLYLRENPAGGAS